MIFLQLFSLELDRELGRDCSLELGLRWQMLVSFSGSPPSSTRKLTTICYDRAAGTLAGVYRRWMYFVFCDASYWRTRYSC